MSVIRRRCLLPLLLAAASLAIACDDGGGSGGTDATMTASDVTGGDATADATSTTPDGTTSEGDTSATTDAGDTGPDVPSTCADGAVQCSVVGDVETCTAGQWMTTATCDRGCLGGACAVDGDFGTCASPLVTGVGKTVRGSTDTTSNPLTWSQACRSAYAMQTGVSASTTGPETVYEFTVETAGQLTISLDSVDATYFGVYVRSACVDPGSDVAGMCDANTVPGGPIEMTAFFAPGTYQVVVDDFGSDGEGVGQFDLTIESGLLPECGDHIGQIVDVSEPVLIQGDTANGVTSMNWLGGECPVIQDTSGQENLYIFGLAEKSRVQISATPLEPASSRLGLYIRTTCDERFDQVACGHSPGDASGLIDEVLPAGGYYLFIDDFGPSIDEAQTYELEINVTPE